MHKFAKLNSFLKYWLTLKNLELWLLVYPLKEREFLRNNRAIPRKLNHYYRCR